MRIVYLLFCVYVRDVVTLRCIEHSLMRLLYVSGTYAQKAWSGGELSAHTLLKTLKRLGLAEILVFTDRRAGISAGA